MMLHGWTWMYIAVFCCGGKCANFNFSSWCNDAIMQCAMMCFLWKPTEKKPYPIRKHSNRWRHVPHWYCATIVQTEFLIISRYARTQDPATREHNTAGGARRSRMGPDNSVESIYVGQYILSTSEHMCAVCALIMFVCLFDVRGWMLTMRSICWSVSYGPAASVCSRCGLSIRAELNLHRVQAHKICYDFLV